MSLFLIVRRHEELNLAVSEASKLLSLQRVQEWYLREPEEVEPVLGVWVHEALDEALPVWSPASPSSPPERTISPSRVQPSIVVRSAIQRSGRWALCWIDDVALLGAFDSSDRRSAIDALLTALSAPELEAREASFVPVFAGELSPSTIEEHMRELHARHPERLGAHYMHESRDLGRDRSARSAA